MEQSVSSENIQQGIEILRNTNETLLKNVLNELNIGTIIKDEQISPAKEDKYQEEKEKYYEICQRKYDEYWIEFDVLTRTFLPTAEYLYDKLDDIEAFDYSAVIVELCKALENELLTKLFRRYAKDIVSRKKGNQLDVDLRFDKSILQKQTGQFAGAIIKSVKGSFYFTLGQMRTTLNQLLDPELIQKSKLLKDFKDYLEKNIKMKELISNEYMEQIYDLSKNYRNPAAHSELIEKERSKVFKDWFPEIISYFEKCVI